MRPNDMNRPGGPAVEPALARLADWCRGDREARLPVAAIDKARLCVADFLSSTLTVDLAERSGMAWHAIGRPSEGAATIIGTRHRAAPDAAAFVNATSASSTSRSDTFAESATHPGMTVIPPILAICEQRDLPVSRLLDGVVIAYEAMAGLARVFVTPATTERFRPSGLVGAMASAAGVAHALGLDAERTRHALAIAAQSISGLNQWAREGTTDHVHHIAYAASNGLRAALLAESGAEGPRFIFEGPSGLCRALDVDAGERLLHRDPDSTFDILSVVFKPAPVCMYAQVPVQAALLLARQGRLKPDEVREIEVRLCRMGAEYPGCANSGPIRTYQDAKQSIPFSVATVLREAAVVDEAWRDFTNEPTVALAARIRVIADPQMTAVFPERLPVSIRAVLADGSERAVEVDDFTPMTDGALIERLLRVARPRLGDAQAERTVALLHENGASCTALAAQLRRPWEFEGIAGL